MSAIGAIACELSDLKVYYPIRTGVLQRTTGYVKAVDGVDLTIHRGETIAIVGESGCGKSSLARALLGLEPAASGVVQIHPRTSDRSPVVRAVFQDPYASLDPRWTIGRAVKEGMPRERSEKVDRVIDLLERVGLDDNVMGKFPHQLSGGQQQRVAIARALAGDPDLIVLDEPTSALDVSIQAQILNLLKDLQTELDLTYVLISHDLATVGQVADRILVMYLGRVMELGSQIEVVQDPVHPYTQSLLESVLTVEKGRVKLEEQTVQGDVPSPRNPPSGCRFRTRCPYVQPECSMIKYSMESWIPGHSYAECIHVSSTSALKRTVKM